MMKLRENEEAVSPVIGVILMVAITVILAAVIAAFVFGMGSGVQTTKVVAATASADHSGTEKAIYITYQGGPDADLVKEVTYTIDGQPGPAPITGGGTGGSEKSVTVGAAVKVTSGTITSGDIKIESGTKNHVSVTARFKDGSHQVILDTFV